MCKVSDPQSEDNMSPHCTTMDYHRQHHEQHQHQHQATMEKILQVYPGAMSNQDLVSKVQKDLASYGFTKETTLVATSLCSDEVNRPLEQDFSNAYETKTFSMGGLAGFPFGGLTSFAAMASHIPDDGSCIVVYGPHVGIDSNGNVGTVERRGRKQGGACCGSANAAAIYVLKVHSGEIEPHAALLESALDAQQHFVCQLLLPHTHRLTNPNKDAYVELPLALFEAQKQMMQQIVQRACCKVAGEGNIALVGGVQINTPPDMSDYFLPLQLDVYDNTGIQLENLLLESS